jgi:hypothetical protein
MASRLLRGTGGFTLTLLFVAVLSGCSRSSRGSLSGKVTFDGQPVEDGTIMLIPEDGKGKEVGGTINGGRYSLNAIPVGRKKVLVTSNSHALPDERTRSLVMQARAKGTKMPAEVSKRPKVAPPIPPEACTGLVVEIAAGSQSRDFDLTKPGATARNQEGSGKKGRAVP